MGNYSANPSGFISSVPYQSSAAGWTNTTTFVNTPYNVNLTGDAKSLYFTASGGITGRIFAFGGNNFFVGTNTATPITFRTSDTDRMTLNATGALGIGTTSPTATLDVRALNTGTPNIVAQATAGQTANIIQANDASGNWLFGVDPANKIINSYAVSADSVYTVLSLRKAGNASSSSSRVDSGQVLGRLRFSGYNGSSYNHGAYIDAVTTQAFNSTGAGTRLDFYTTTTNSLFIQSQSQGCSGLDYKKWQDLFNPNHYFERNKKSCG
jgi:hypothetical protein